MTLYARWAAVYAITFNNLQNGTHGNPSAFSELDFPLILTAASRNGFAFTGWWTALSGGEQVIAITAAGNITLYARWALIAYTVTFNNLYGTAHTNPPVFTVETSVITLAAPDARAGYTFTGWWTAAADGTQVTEITPGTTHDIVLYARWTAVEPGMNPWWWLLIGSGSGIALWILLWLLVFKRRFNRRET